MKCSQPIGIEERWRQPIGSGGWSGRRSPTFAPDLNGRNSVEGQLGASLRLFWLPLTFLENEVKPNTFRQERVEHCTQEAMETPWSRAKFILSIFRANSGNKCRRSNWIKQSLPLFSNAPDIRYTSFSSSRIAKNLIKLLDNFQVMCVFTYIRLIKCVSLYPPHSAMATRARATSHVENQVREFFYTIFRLYVQIYVENKIIYCYSEQSRY